MNKITLSLAAILISGCAQNQYYVGGLVHPYGMDEPDFRARNPICLAGYEYQLTENIKGFMEHQSDCFRKDNGGGYNAAGVKYYFNR